MSVSPATAAALRRYEENKLKIKELTEENDALKVDIIPNMPEDGPVKTEYGTFSVRRKPSYIYSAFTQAAESELKDRKVREVQEGIATVKEGEPYLQYDPKKGD